MSVLSPTGSVVRYHAVIPPRRGMWARVLDRVKRPLFVGFFVLTLVGLVLISPVLLLVGTTGFGLVGLLHLIQRNSRVPLLGHYVGVGRFLRVTPAGRVLLVITLITGVAAFNMSINLLYLVLGIQLAVVIISGVLSENSLRRVTVRTFLPATAFAGERFTQKLSVRNDKRFLPSYSLLLATCFEGTVCEPAQGEYVLKVGARGQTTLTTEIVLDHRGRQRADQVRIATEFPFGLAEKWSYYPSPEEVVVYPALGRLLRPVIPGWQHRHWRGSDKMVSKPGQDEFWGLREYRDGDNPRHIHWRSSARLRKRLVKQFQREQSSRLTLLLDTHVPRSTDPEELLRFERAVSFTATLAVRYLREGFEVALAAGASPALRLPAGRGLRQYRRILGTLAELTTESNGGFAALVESLDSRFLEDSVVVAVLLNGARCPYRTLSTLQEHRHTVRVVDVSGPNFTSLFIPPDILTGETTP